MIIEKYYTRLTLDFHTNKRICEEIAIIPSKKLRNKIAGYVHVNLWGRFFIASERSDRSSLACLSFFYSSERFVPRFLMTD